MTRPLPGAFTKVQFHDVGRPLATPLPPMWSPSTPWLRAIVPAGTPVAVRFAGRGAFLWLPYADPGPHRVTAVIRVHEPSQVAGRTR